MASGLATLDIWVSVYVTFPLLRSNNVVLLTRSWKAQFWWIGIVIGMWIVGWVLAELIPVSGILPVTVRSPDGGASFAVLQLAFDYR